MSAEFCIVSCVGVSIPFSPRKLLKTLTVTKETCFIGIPIHVAAAARRGPSPKPIVADLGRGKLVAGFQGNGIGPMAVVAERTSN